MSLEDADVDPEALLDGDANELKTSLPGITVTTKLSDASAEELEELHKRQLDYALERAEEAKEATRM